MPYLTPGSLRYFKQEPVTSPSLALSLPTVFEALPPPKWEYHTIDIDPREEPPLDEARLCQLGQEGWLLAAILETPGGERVTRITYYFVRSL